MKRSELKKMAYREASFRLGIELDDFEHWTLENGLTSKDKDLLFEMITDIKWKLRDKGSD